MVRLICQLENRTALEGKGCSRFASGHISAPGLACVSRPNVCTGEDSNSLASAPSSSRGRTRERLRDQGDFVESSPHRPSSGERFPSKPPDPQASQGGILLHWEVTALGEISAAGGGRFLSSLFCNFYNFRWFFARAKNRNENKKLDYDRYHSVRKYQVRLYTNSQCNGFLFSGARVIYALGTCIRGKSGPCTRRKRRLEQRPAQGSGTMSHTVTD